MRWMRRPDPPATKVAGLMVAALLWVGCANSGDQSTGPNNGRGVATRLAFAEESSDATAGGVITPVTVMILDAADSLAPAATNRITIAIGTNPAGGTLSGSTTIAAVNGVARFLDVKIDKPGSGYTLTASATGLSGATSVAFNVWCRCWSSREPMPTPRTDLAVGVVNGILYAVGGSSGGYLTTVEAYDPVTNSWTTKAPMPTARARLAVGVVNGILYAVGGFNNSSGFLTTVEAYDPVTNSWTTEAPLPTPRADLGAGVVNDILYAVGGSRDNSIFLERVDAYDPVTNSWTTKPRMPTHRSSLGVGAANGVLYAVGGFNAYVSNGNCQLCYVPETLTTFEAYDPGANSWTTKERMPTPRLGLSVGVLNGHLYALGGYNSGRGSLTTVEVYDPVANTWTTTAPLPTRRSGFAVGVVNGVLYAVGAAENDAYKPEGS